MAEQYEKLAAEQRAMEARIVQARRAAADAALARRHTSRAESRGGRSQRCDSALSDSVLRTPYLDPAYEPPPRPSLPVPPPEVERALARLRVPGAATAAVAGEVGGPAIGGDERGWSPLVRPAAASRRRKATRTPPHGVPRPPRPAAVPPSSRAALQQLEYDSHAAIDLDDEPELPSAPRRTGGWAAAAAARSGETRSGAEVDGLRGAELRSRHAARRSRSTRRPRRCAARSTRRPGGEASPLRRPRARRAHSRRRVLRAARSAARSPARADIQRLDLGVDLDLGTELSGDADAQRFEQAAPMEGRRSASRPASREGRSQSRPASRDGVGRCACRPASSSAHLESAHALADDPRAAGDVPSTPGLDTLVRRAEERLRALQLTEVTPDGPVVDQAAHVRAPPLSAELPSHPYPSHPSVASTHTTGGALRSSMVAESRMVPLPHEGGELPSWLPPEPSRNLPPQPEARGAGLTKRPGSAASSVSVAESTSAALARRTEQQYARLAQYEDKVGALERGLLDIDLQIARPLAGRPSRTQRPRRDRISRAPSRDSDAEIEARPSVEAEAWATRPPPTRWPAAQWLRNLEEQLDR